MAEAAERPQKHAVLVIHGIGEHGETDTARTFAKAAASAEDNLFPAPYRDGRGSNQRIYTIRWGEASDGEPSLLTTDVGEGYWAYRFRDTVWSHMTGWLGPLVSTPRRQVPDRIGRGERMSSKDLFTLSLLLLSLILLVAVSWLGLIGRYSLGSALLAVFASAAVVFVALILVAGSGLKRVVGAVLILFGFGGVFLAGASGIALGREEVVDVGWWIIILVLLALLLVAAGILAVLKTDTLTMVYGLVLVAGLGALSILGVALQMPTSLLQILGTAASVAFPIALALASAELLPSVGDAARYLRQHPDNEKENRKIRKVVMDRLAELHRAKDVWGRYRYSRITVVGHSLGAVIGYDALARYWFDVNHDLEISDSPSDRSPAEMALLRERARRTADLEQRAHALVEASKAMKPTGSEATARPNTELAFAEALREYREAQWSLCRTLDGPGPMRPDTAEEVPRRWIITDFVTLGSPLGYLDFLTGGEGNRDVKNPETSDFIRRRVEREISDVPARGTDADPDGLTSPDNQTHLVRYARHDVHGHDSGVRFLHHAAVFGPTRWTNLYFGNDLVGGPVAPLLGRGIYDICLESPRLSPLSFLTKYPHSSYWKDPTGKNESLVEGYKESHEALTSVISRSNTKDPSIPIADRALFAEMKKARDEWSGMEARRPIGLIQAVALTLMLRHEWPVSRHLANGTLRQLGLWLRQRQSLRSVDPRPTRRGFRSSVILWGPRT